jgi:hypothetical protein
VHSWDLATAIATDSAIDDELAIIIYNWCELALDQWRGLGIFAPPVPVPVPDDQPDRPPRRPARPPTVVLRAALVSAGGAPRRTWRLARAHLRAAWPVR